jgi:hypothetical protein
MNANNQVTLGQGGFIPNVTYIPMQPSIMVGTGTNTEMVIPTIGTNTNSIVFKTAPDAEPVTVEEVASKDDLAAVAALAVDNHDKLEALQATIDKALLKADAETVTAATEDGDTATVEVEVPAYIAEAVNAAATAAPATTPSENRTQQEAPTTFHASGVACREGVLTRDGRLFPLGSLTWDNTIAPWPFRFDKDGSGHDPATVVGQCWNYRRVRTSETTADILFDVVFDLGKPEGIEAKRLVDSGMMRSVSIDGTMGEGFKVVYVEAGDPVVSLVDADTGDYYQGWKGDTRVIFGIALGGTTLVDIPAFAHAGIDPVQSSAAGETLDTLLRSTGEVVSVDHAAIVQAEADLALLGLADLR